MQGKEERRSIKRQNCKCEINLSYFNSDSHLPGLVFNFSPEGGYLETTRPRRAGLVPPF